MKRYTQLVVVVVFASLFGCSGSKDDIKPDLPISIEYPNADRELISKIKDIFGSAIPDLNKYKYASTSKYEESGTLVALATDKEVDAFFFDSQKQILFKQTINVPKSDDGVALRLHAMYNAHDNNGIKIFAVCFRKINVDVIKEFDEIPTKYYFLNKDKLILFKEANHNFFNSLGIKEMKFSKLNDYFFFVENATLNFYDLIDYKFVKSYDYWYEWGTNYANNILIYNNLSDIVEVRQNTRFKGYYMLTSTKIALNNGDKVTNWDIPNAFYIESPLLKTGEIETVTYTLKEVNSILEISVHVYSKRWNGNNVLVEKNDTKSYKFRLSTGEKID